jgi:hypothetical protein
MSRRMVEKEAFSLSDGGAVVDLLLPPGQSLDSAIIGKKEKEARAIIEMHNPGMNIKTNHMREQYPMVFGGKFVRLLVDDGGTVRSISRK